MTERRQVQAGSLRPTSKFARKQRDFADNGGDPLESMGNLFDVAVLIGVGFMILSVSSMGLKELYSKENVTVVKNPGTAQMEIITKENGKIRTMKRTDQQAQGMGQEVGKVYRLEDGRTVWIPTSGDPGAETTATTTTNP